MASSDKDKEDQIFHMEIPRAETDPFSEMNTDIHDAHEATDYDKNTGLSDKQVVELARDSLEQAGDSSKHERSYEQSLFPSDSASGSSY